MLEKDNNLEQELEANNNIIQHEGNNYEKPNGGFNFSEANTVKEVIMESRSVKVQRVKEIKKRLIIKTSIISILVCSLISLMIYGILYFEKPLKKELDPSVIEPTQIEGIKPTIIAGEKQYDIEVAVIDAKYVDNEVQVRFIIINKGKNTFFPILSNTTLTDTTGVNYAVNGLLSKDLTKGVPQGQSIQGLFSFRSEKKDLSKEFIIRVVGSDIEHFTFDYKIPFKIK